MLWKEKVDFKSDHAEWKEIVLVVRKNTMLGERRRSGGWGHGVTERACMELSASCRRGRHQGGVGTRVPAGVTGDPGLLTEAHLPSERIFPSLAFYTHSSLERKRQALF